MKTFKEYLTEKETLTEATYNPKFYRTYVMPDYSDEYVKKYGQDRLVRRLTELLYVKTKNMVVGFDDLNDVLRKNPSKSVLKDFFSFYEAAWKEYDNYISNPSNFRADFYKEIKNELKKKYEQLKKDYEQKRLFYFHLLNVNGLKIGDSEEIAIMKLSKLTHTLKKYSFYEHKHDINFFKEMSEDDIRTYMEEHRLKDDSTHIKLLTNFGSNINNLLVHFENRKVSKIMHPISS